VGGRRFRALPRDQIELCQLFLLGARRDQRAGAVQLTDDLEDRFLPLIGWRVRRQQPPDSKVKLGTLCCRDQRVSGFLNTVVDETVSISRTENEPRPQTLLQTTVPFL